MTRSDAFYDYLEAQKLEPSAIGDTVIPFKFKRRLFFLNFTQDTEFISFRTNIHFDEPPEESVLVEIVNTVNNELPLIKSWFQENLVALTVGTFCAIPGELDANLLGILEELIDAADLVAECIAEMSKNGLGVAAGKDVSSRSISRGSEPIKEAVLMNPSSETQNKLRWHVDINGTVFQLYIPKWRVPSPWPKQIIVAVSNQEIRTISIRSGSNLDADHTNIDPLLPIIAIVKKEFKYKRTARYRPIGEPVKWEIGTPYIPYALLPAGQCDRLQIEVRWDFSTGTWPI